ncbi:Hypothetical protein D9617_5g070040 [Elsinoe fawcettii]|nr:Hypothetical protein D9617_5g070040 [Elsinoe fawcettii]
MGSLERPTRTVHTRDGMFAVQYWLDLRAPSELVSIDNYLMDKQNCLFSLDPLTLKTTLHCRDPGLIPERSSMGVRSVLEDAIGGLAQEALERLDRYARLRAVKAEIRDMTQRLPHMKGRSQFQMACALHDAKQSLASVVASLRGEKQQKEVNDVALLQSRRTRMNSEYNTLTQNAGYQWTQQELAEIASCIRRGDLREFQELVGRKRTEMTVGRSSQSSRSRRSGRRR